MIDPREVATIIEGRSLTFPIRSKTEFVAQMVAAGDRLVIGGAEYDTAYASALLPEFFYPIASTGDLLAKATELLVSRGLALLPSAGSTEDRS